MNSILQRSAARIAALLTATIGLYGDNSCLKPCAPKCPPKPCEQPCTQPCPPTQICPGQDPCCPPWATPLLNAGYDYPARTRVACPFDAYVEASFIYLQPIQENMSLGLLNKTAGVNVTQIPETLPASAFPNGLIGTQINMDFDYKPGFQVAVGGYFDYDNWDMMGQYTWFHGSQNKHTSVTTNQQIFPNWGHPLFQGSNAYNSVKGNWDLKMDILEFDLGRWYYVGTQLTFRPSLGARAAWIRQNATVTYTNNGTLGFGTTTDTNVNKSKTRSWAIGPEVTLDTNWTLGKGFRLYGFGEADLLFTKYTKATNHVAHTTAVATPAFKADGSKILAVRTHLDLELGFGWSTYIDCHGWFLDIAAGYGFQVFFDQNMFPYYNDDIMVAQSIAPMGNLYLQGLTVRFKLDF